MPNEQLAENRERDFYDTLEKVLKTDKRFFAEDGTLLRNKIHETALNMDTVGGGGTTWFTPFQPRNKNPFLY
jgi:hypothetical protein